MNLSTEWWSTFFTDTAFDFWRSAVTEEQTRAEADFIEKSLALAPMAKVLDVPCGEGRHSLALASRGYRVTGVDLARGAIERARREAGERGLDVAWENRDMRDLPWQAGFDGVFCFGNSFAYMDDDGNRQFLEAVHGALKPGGRFVLQTGCVAEAIIPNFQPRTWHQMGDGIGLRDAVYYPAEGRAETEYTFIRGGHFEKKRASYRIYSCLELLRLTESVGFTDLEALAPNGEPFRLGSGMLQLLGRKP